MKLAVMQPYFLPYIGYYQLMKAVDVFVFYDDVTFIKQGWINRNRMLLNGKSYTFNLEMKGASSYLEINKIKVGNNQKKLLKTFTQAYKKAPFFKNIEPLFYRIFESTENNLAKYIIGSNQLIASHIGLKTKFMVSSDIEKNNSLKGQDKIIEICKKLAATKYFNPIGGKDLYSKGDFANNRIQLSFLQSRKIIYRQFANDFIPWLSIIDVLMFNSIDEINVILDNYELL